MMSSSYVPKHMAHLFVSICSSADLARCADGAEVSVFLFVALVVATQQIRQGNQRVPFPHQGLGKDKVQDYVMHHTTRYPILKG